MRRRPRSKRQPTNKETLLRLAQETSNEVPALIVQWRQLAYMIATTLNPILVSAGALAPPSAAARSASSWAEFAENVLQYPFVMDNRMKRTSMPRMFTVQPRIKGGYVREPYASSHVPHG